MSVDPGRGEVRPEIIRLSYQVMTKVKTGGVTPKSGQYRVSGTKLEITLSKGDRIPPYGGEAKTFVLVDKTKHKR